MNKYYLKEGNPGKALLFIITFNSLVDISLSELTCPSDDDNLPNNVNQGNNVLFVILCNPIKIY